MSRPPGSRRSEELSGANSCRQRPPVVASRGRLPWPLHINKARASTSACLRTYDKATAPGQLSAKGEIKDFHLSSFFFFPASLFTQK